MKHYHFDSKDDDYMSHSHAGGNKWHEHMCKRLMGTKLGLKTKTSKFYMGYGRTRRSFKMKQSK